MAFLCHTDSYYEPYLLIAVIGIYAMASNRIHSRENASAGRVDTATAVLLSLCIALANYQYLEIYDWKSASGILVNVPNAIVIIGTGCGLFLEIMSLLTRLDAQNKTRRIVDTWTRRNGILLFVLTFAAIVLVDCLMLFLCSYPGSLSPDSISQMRQLLTGTYSNHHPFYHTMIIKFWINVGIALFGDINAAVATYSVFSIVVVALCFAYAVSTIYRASSNLKISSLIALWYLVMPFHIRYSYTMWKDVIWGAVVTLFAISTYRILKGIGSSVLNAIIMTVSSVGVCLLRSNGYFCYVFTTIVFIVLLQATEQGGAIRLCSVSDGCIILVCSNTGI